MTDDLRAKAEAAKEGQAERGHWWDAGELVYDSWQNHEDAAYIAAADPTTILALLDERDRIERALEDANALLAKAFDERDRLLAVLAAARTDHDYRHPKEADPRRCSIGAAIARYDEGKAQS